MFKSTFLLFLFWNFLKLFPSSAPDTLCLLRASNTARCFRVILPTAPNTVQATFSVQGGDVSEPW